MFNFNYCYIAIILLFSFPVLCMEQAGAPSTQSPEQPKLEQTEKVIEQMLMPFVIVSHITQASLDSDNLHVKIRKKELEKLVTSHHGLPVLDWDQMIAVQIRCAQEKEENQ